MTAAGPYLTFEAFYRAEHDRMFHFFLRKVGRDEAPDLVQEAFTCVLRSGAFDRLENPNGYLTRTARNLVINRARTWHRKGCMLYPLDEARDAPLPPEQERKIEQHEFLDNGGDRCRRDNRHFLYCAAYRRAHGLAANLKVG